MSGCKLYYSSFNLVNLSTKADAFKEQVDQPFHLFQEYCGGSLQCRVFINPLVHHVVGLGSSAGSSPHCIYDWCSSCNTLGSLMSSDQHPLKDKSVLKQCSHVHVCIETVFGRCNCSVLARKRPLPVRAPNVTDGGPRSSFCVHVPRGFMFRWISSKVSAQQETLLKPYFRWTLKNEDCGLY